jgi:flagellar motor protein MotB
MAKCILYFRGGRGIKSGLILPMKTYLMTFGIVTTIMAMPVLAQSISPFQPEELKAINEQPLVPPQGVMGKPKPPAPESAPKRVIIGPNYTTDQPGEAEAKALGEDSAQPLNPREGLITIPFN